jgi:hypothetical protein
VCVQAEAAAPKPKGAATGGEEETPREELSVPNDGVLKTDGGDEIKPGEENGGIEPPELTAMSAAAVVVAAPTAPVVPAPAAEAAPARENKDTAEAADDEGFKPKGSPAPSEEPDEEGVGAGANPRDGPAATELMMEGKDPGTPESNPTDPGGSSAAVPATPPTALLMERGDSGTPESTPTGPGGSAADGDEAARDRTYVSRRAAAPATRSSTRTRSRRDFSSDVAVDEGRSLMSRMSPAGTCIAAATRDH